MKSSLIAMLIVLAGNTSLWAQELPKILLRPRYTGEYELRFAHLEPKAAVEYRLVVSSTDVVPTRQYWSEGGELVLAAAVKLFNEHLKDVEPVSIECRLLAFTRTGVPTRPVKDHDFYDFQVQLPPKFPVQYELVERGVLKKTVTVQHDGRRSTAFAARRVKVKDQVTKVLGGLFGKGGVTWKTKTFPTFGEASVTVPKGGRVLPHTVRLRSRSPLVQISKVFDPDGRTVRIRYRNDSTKRTSVWITVQYTKTVEEKFSRKVEFIASNGEPTGRLAMGQEYVAPLSGSYRRFNLKLTMPGSGVVLLGTDKPRDGSFATRVENINGKGDKQLVLILDWPQDNRAFSKTSSAGTR